MLNTQKSKVSFFSSKESSVRNSINLATLTLGNVSIELPYCETPSHDRSFLYFKLNDQPELVDEAARLIAERVKALNLANPCFVTPEASTLALAHVLRRQYHIPGITLYKTPQINDIQPVGIEYDTITATNKKTLYLGAQNKQILQGKDIIIIDSVCTTGGTICAVYDLLLKAGVASEQIIEATMLFNEGRDITKIAMSSGAHLSIHRFGMLPLITKEHRPVRIGVVASTSPVKLKAVKDSLKEMMPDEDWDLVGVPSRSGVPEQPLDGETLQGAINRVNEAKQWVSNYDFVLAIESGLFTQENGSYLDKAIVFCETKGGETYIAESDALEFPKACVEEAIRRGVQTCTAGMIMEEQKLISNHKDPHKDLTHGKRCRDDFIKSAVMALCNELLQPQHASHSSKWL